MLRNGIVAVGLAGCAAAGASTLFVRRRLKKRRSNERLSRYPDDTRYELKSSRDSKSTDLEEEDLLELQAPSAEDDEFEQGNDDEAPTYCRVRLSAAYNQKHKGVSMQDSTNPDGLDALPYGAEQEQEENVTGEDAGAADTKVVKLQQQHDEDGTESHVLGVGFGSLGSLVEVKLHGTGWTVQWQRRCSDTNEYTDIPGATEAAYLLQVTDVGKIIRARCENTEGAGPDGVSYAYANGAMPTRLDSVLGAILRLMENQMMTFPAIERNGETGEVAKGRLLQLSGTHAALLSREGNVVRQGSYRHWGESFILSTTDDTRAVLVKFKVYKRRKIIDLEFDSMKARQHAVHAWHHLWTSAAHRNAPLIRMSHHQPAKAAPLLMGHKALRDDCRRMASEAGQQTGGDASNRTTMLQTTSGVARQAKATAMSAMPMSQSATGNSRVSGRFAFANVLLFDRTHKRRIAKSQ